MKHSDDYLTARGANPRTGLISPSVTNSPPKTPLTPESPAEALKSSRPIVAMRMRRAHDNVGGGDGALPQTTVFLGTTRPVLTRANEGKRVWSGSRWRADDKGWYSEIVDATPTDRSSSMSSVVTGYKTSPGQAQAFEHYRRRSRQLSSGEGYGNHSVAPPSPGTVQALGGGHHVDVDGGLAKRASVISVGAGPRKFVAASLALKKYAEDAPGEGGVRYGGGAVGGELLVAKRSATVIRRPDWSETSKMNCSGGGGEANVGLTPAFDFASYTSPGTLDEHRRPRDEPATIAMKHIPGACLHSSSSPPLPSRQNSIPRKALPPVPDPDVTTSTQEHRVPSADRLQHMRVPSRGGGFGIFKTRAPAAASSVGGDLQKARRVSQEQRIQARDPKACSLGCHRSPSGECIAPASSSSATARNVSNSTDSTYRPWSLFLNPRSLPSPSSHSHDLCSNPSPQLSELSLALVFAVAKWILAFVRLPRTGLLDALRDERASPSEKVAAIRALVGLVLQAVVVALGLAVVLQLCTLVKTVLEIMFWPVIVVGRLGGWIG